MAFDLKKTGSRIAGMGALTLKKTKEPKKLFYSMLAVLSLFLVGICYGGLKLYKDNLNKKISDYSHEIDKLEQERKTIISPEIKTFQQRLGAVESLVEGHAYWNNFFKFLEGITLPEVQFINFQAGLGENIINLDGITPTMTTLAQQMVIFQANKMIGETKLSNLAITEKGIKFGFILKIAPEAWSKQGEQKDQNES